MLEELRELKLTEVHLCKESGVARSTIGRLKNGHCVKEEKVRKLKEAFKSLTGKPDQHETKPTDLEVGRLIPWHPEYTPTSASPINRFVEICSGIIYRQVELQSNILPNQRARGKIYEMFHLPPEKRGDFFHQVTRHAEVCRIMKGTPNIITNLSAIPLKDLEGLYLVDEWYDGDLLVSCWQEVVGWSLRDKFKFLGEMIVAIRAIHAKNIVLRALSLHTILVNCRSQDFCLTNFELSKLVDFGKTVSKNWKPSEFLAPEVGKYNTADVRNDIFSWGILCGFLLENDMDSDLMPKNTRLLIRKATQTLPDNRYGNMSELKSAWDKLKFGTS